MKIGILGGGSAFALSLARLAHANGIDCFGIGRSEQKPPAFWLAPPSYRYYQAHIVDQLGKTVRILDEEEPDVVVCLAAQGEGAASFNENAPDFFRTNTWGLSNLVREINGRAWLERFVNISTSEGYGSVNAPSKETDPVNESSPYALSKVTFDKHLGLMHKYNGFPMNIIRPSNAIVEGQQLYRIVPKASVHAFAKKKLPLHGGGKAQKSYIHADDLSAAILAVIEKAPFGKTYNVGPANPITIRVLVEHVIEACGASWEEIVEESEDRVGQDGRYWLDSTAIREDCGWRPTMSLAQAVERVVRWVKDWPELLTMPTSYEHRS